MGMLLAKFGLLVVAGLVAACVRAPGFDELLGPARVSD